MEPVILWILAVILVLVGIAGTLLPVLPGVAAVFGGLLIAAWADNFQRVGTFTLIILGLLTVCAFAIDFIASVLGAKRMGASKLALVGAAVGGLFGIFFGLPGIFLGPFVGAVAGELIHRGKLNESAQAAKVGLGTWLGILFGSLAKMALAFVMVGIFLTSYAIG